MTPALKTPETIARIRAQAPTRMASDIAHDLGWDVARLERVAKEFSIELYGARPTPTIDAVKSRLTPADINAGMTLSEIAAVLPKRQAQVLNALRTSVDEDYISRKEVMDRSDLYCNDGEVTDAVRAIEAHLKNGKALWRIDRRRGPGSCGGGYRLVTLRPE